MDTSKPLPSGTGPDETHESILASELARLQKERSRMKEENSSYLSRHPELRTLLDELTAAILTSKPSDIVKFSAQFFNSLRNPRNAGPTPLVISGPSGAGKTTLVNLLMQRYPKLFAFAISHTSRPPRVGEVSGVGNHFVDRPVFEAMIEQESFVEHTDIHTNLYGVTFKAVERIRSEGKICILDLDMEDIPTVKNSSLDCRYLFIAPPSIDALESRLRGRSADSEEKIRSRLEVAREEIKFGRAAGNFDVVVVNEDLETALRQVIMFLTRWFPDHDFEKSTGKK